MADAIPKTLDDLRAWLKARDCTITEVSEEDRRRNNSNATHEVRRKKFCQRYAFPPPGHEFVEYVCAFVVEEVEEYIRG